MRAVAWDPSSHAGFRADPCASSHPAPHPVGRSKVQGFWGRDRLGGLIFMGAN